MAEQRPVLRGGKPQGIRVADSGVVHAAYRQGGGLRPLCKAPGSGWVRVDGRVTCARCNRQIRHQELMRQTREIRERRSKR